MQDRIWARGVMVPVVGICGCGKPVAVTGEDPVTVRGSGSVRGQEGRFKKNLRPIKVKVMESGHG